MLFVLLKDGWSVSFFQQVHGFRIGYILYLMCPVLGSRLALKLVRQLHALPPWLALHRFGLQDHHLSSVQTKICLPICICAMSLGNKITILEEKSTNSNVPKSPIEPHRYKSLNLSNITEKNGGPQSWDCSMLDTSFAWKCIVLLSLLLFFSWLEMKSWLKE